MELKFVTDPGFTAPPYKDKSRPPFQLTSNPRVYSIGIRMEHEGVDIFSLATYRDPQVPLEVQSTIAIASEDGSIGTISIDQLVDMYKEELKIFDEQTSVCFVHLNTEQLAVLQQCSFNQDTLFDYLYSNSEPNTSLFEVIAQAEIVETT